MQVFSHLCCSAVNCKRSLPCILNTAHCDSFVILRLINTVYVCMYVPYVNWITNLTLQHNEGFQASAST